MPRGMYFHAGGCRELFILVAQGQFQCEAAGCTYDAGNVMPIAGYRCSCVDGYSSGFCDYRTTEIVAEYAAECAILSSLDVARTTATRVAVAVLSMSTNVIRIHVKMVQSAQNRLPLLYL